ncbi:NMD3 family-domain-containing protein [Pisolithus croceorrhizus]|nr:NMD3 family-domain-containing protein [Pisolithus croceorrhizus]
MEFIPGPAVTRVLCADCGTPIVPNSANLCVACLRNTVDITEGIPKQSSVSFCRNCERFLSPPQAWILARPESQELLALCLKRLKGLNKVRLTEAHFIWTEPHSRRLRVSLTIQKEVLASTILEQVFEIEYLVHNTQCPDCTRLAAKNTWKALVQVRQKVAHKRTLILKHGAQKDTVSVKEVRDGLDFFYSQRSHAYQDGLKARNSSFPLDTHSNTANYKFTYSVEIAPICKDDLLAPSPTFSSLTICTRVGASFQLLDVNTLQSAEVNSQIFWRSPFSALAGLTDLVEFTVLDVEPVGTSRGRWVLADAQVALAGAFRSHTGTHTNSETVMDYETAAESTQIFHTRTHLGAILQPGDTAMGYYLTSSNFNSDDFAKLSPDRIPDVVLVKKAYPNRRKKSKARPWKLRSIAKEEGEEGETGVDEDYELFLRDLEEDPELRGAVNLYKVQDVKMKEGRDGNQRRRNGQYGMDVDEEEHGPEGTTMNGEEEEEEPDFPEVGLDELLEDFDEMTLQEAA